MFQNLRLLFLSRRERREREKIRFRQTQNNLRRRVDQLKNAADRYWNLAQKAHALQSREQFTQLGEHYLRLINAINRWSCMLLKLEAIELRRDEVVATTEFMEGLDSVNKVIMQGAGPEEVAKMRTAIELSMERSRATEIELDEFMEATGDALQDGSLSDALPELERLLVKPSTQAELSDVRDEFALPFADAMRQLQASSSKTTES